ncbi:MAG TPA: sulfur carrier protein ThiS [Bryobacteraceae bacterium]|nr:sulfur carrier protein ThiS [Bryobacteraceae bacterium]
MNLIVNGDAYRHEGNGTLAELFRELQAEPARTAVLLNGEVAPRGRWPEVRLAEGDRVELVTFAGGG